MDVNIANRDIIMTLFKFRRFFNTHPSFSKKGFSLFFIALIILGGFDGLQSSAQVQNFIVKKVDLSRYGSPAFIDHNQLAQKLAIGFQNCNLVILNQSMEVEKNIHIDKCVKLFKSRYGILNGESIISSAIYSGNSSLFNGQNNFSIPIHKAAVTDSFLINNYLVSSSDDGSVQINLLNKFLDPKVKSYKIYRGIGVARNLAGFPSSGSNISKIAVSYDSGEIAVLSLGKDTVVGKVKSISFQPIESRINALKFSQNGDKLIVAYFTGNLVEIDSKNGQIRQLLKVESLINSLDVSKKYMIAIADDQGYVRLISPSGKLLEEHKISSVAVTGVLFVDDQTIMATDATGYLYQFSLTRKQQ